MKAMLSRAAHSEEVPEELRIHARFKTKRLMKVLKAVRRAYGRVEMDIQYSRAVITAPSNPRFKMSLRLSDGYIGRK